ncbi:hypothetical protein AAG570_010667 [Ranatra chinensis]|uniref:G-patch domain-containing protein n=1 Tax=Ranatra chinensis TaxID=642074 RepID=A0ABD0YNG2_9HEMI
MAGEKKKICFGFSKISKRNAIAPPINAKPDTSVQYIECVEENSIKVIGGNDSIEKKELVIPMKNDNTLRDNLLATIEKRNKVNNEIVTSEPSDTQVNIKAEQENKPLTLDEMAAKEILEEAKKEDIQKEEPKIHTVPLVSNIGVTEKESTLEDYDNIPVSDFGLAMLRGMGWAPDKGIGKNEKLIKPPSPILRPKGMGLGADKVVRKENAAKPKAELVLKKGSSVKVLAGQYKHCYGRVEGFDDIGRVIIKLSISNSVVSLSEFMVEVVSNEDYIKNSKVLNVSKFYEYKEKEIEGNNGNKLSSQNDRNEKVVKPESGKFQKAKNKNDEISDSESSMDGKTKSNKERKNGKKNTKPHSRSSSVSSDSSYEKSSRKKSSRHKKHKLSRKHRSRSRSRSRQDKFKRKHRYKSPERKSKNK